MRLKPVLFLLAALIIIWGAYIFSESMVAKRQSALDLADRVLLVDGVQEVLSVELSGKAFENPIIITRQSVNKAFGIISPIKSPADQGNVIQMVNALAMARTKKRIKAPQNLGDFGLDPPWIELKLKSAKRKNQTIFLGDLSPTGESLYARPEAGSMIWLLPGAVKAGLNQSLFSLRDKKILDFVVLDVKEAVLQAHSSNSLILRRKERKDADIWETGEKKKIHKDDVLDLLFKIHGLRALAFFDSGINLTAVGLKKPWAKITLTVAEAEKNGIIGILLGATDPSGKQIYIRRLNGGPVMMVEKEKIKSLWAQEKMIKEAGRSHNPAKGLPKGD